MIPTCEYAHERAISRRAASASGPVRAGAALLLAGIIAAVIVGASGNGAAAHAIDSGYPCLWHGVTGVVGPLCGMTHALIAFGAGDSSAAFAAHPLFPLLLAFALWGSVTIALGRRLTVGTYQLLPRHLLAATAVVWAVKLVAEYA